VEETAAREAEEKVKTEGCVQQQINEEQRKYRLQEQQEMEEIARRQQEQEEEWYLRKLDFEKQLRESKDVGAGKGKTETFPGQSVILQKYTITPFTSEYTEYAASTLLESVYSGREMGIRRACGKPSEVCGKKSIERKRRFKQQG